VVALWAIVLLAAYLQRQAGLSTVGEAHLLAVDWLGWICYLFDKLGLNKIAVRWPAKAVA